MKRAVFAAIVAASCVTSADVCKDKACVEACLDGDPVSCVLAYHQKHQTPWTLEEKDRERACDKLKKKPPQADVCGAYLWRDGNKAEATGMWAQACDDERAADGSCEAMASARPSEHWTAAMEMRCAGSFYELPCRLGARFTSRVKGEVGGTKYELDMPAMNLGDDTTRKRPGEHFVLWGLDHAAVTVSVKNGSLACEHVEGKTGTLEHAEMYAWLPAGWGDKACKSLKKR